MAMIRETELCDLNRRILEMTHSPIKFRRLNARLRRKKMQDLNNVMSSLLLKTIGENKEDQAIWLLGHLKRL